MTPDFLRYIIRICISIVKIVLAVCIQLVVSFLSFFSVNNSIEPNCLSVIDNIPTCPSGGRKDLTRLICTSAFSALGQCRIYIENWNIMNPS